MKPNQLATSSRELIGFIFNAPEVDQMQQAFGQPLVFHCACTTKTIVPARIFTTR